MHGSVEAVLIVGQAEQDVLAHLDAVDGYSGSMERVRAQCEAGGRAGGQAGRQR